MSRYRTPQEVQPSPDRIGMSWMGCCPVKICVNGGERQVADGLTIAKLLQELEMDPRYLAVERNRELVPRSQHKDCVLTEGDEIEIVTLVGGG